MTGHGGWLPRGSHPRVRYFLLGQRLNDRSPLRLAREDNKNNHRAETEIGLRLMRQPLPTLNADRYRVSRFP